MYFLQTALLAMGLRYQSCSKVSIEVFDVSMPIVIVDMVGFPESKATLAWHLYSYCSTEVQSPPTPKIYSQDPHRGI
jgi:hypothetical protein